MMQSSSWANPGEKQSRRASIGLVLLMLTSILSAVAPGATASEIVLTDAIQVVQSGHNDRMMALDADSQGNIHMVWSRNTNHLYYKMLDPRGETLIESTQISDPGAQRAWHPDIRVDHDDMVHVVWTDKSGQYKIMYTLLDPSLDDQNGDSSLDSVLSIVPDDFEVANDPQNRDWPAIDVDSDNNPHIVWEDSFEPLELFYQQLQIYYKMLSVDQVSRSVIVEIDNTLLTPILGHKGHPDIAVDVDDFVQIVWDDTRGGKVEMVVPIDTSGSMNTEWADMCVVFYGGNFASGGYFPGLKPLLVNANMTVYETLYALSGNWPAAATSGNCANAYQTGGSGSQGPRNTTLGNAPGDDSGGIRDSCVVFYNICWEDGGLDQKADSIDLTPYAGQTIDIRFRFRSGLEGTVGPEGSEDFSGLDGFAIDNISVRTRDVTFGASTVQSQQLTNLDLVAGESLQVQLTADFVDHTT